MLVAIDDTDGADGGCTTHTALSALASLAGLALRGMPRLVRLNPNCPHKTRGNGAVVLDIVVPVGPRVQVGSWADRPVYAYPDGAAPPSPDAVLDAVWAAVRDAAQPDAEPTVATGDVPEAAYWQAVQTEVRAEDAAVLLADLRGGGRSVVGCAAALAWPGPAASYELIAYRHRTAWGTRRQVDDGPLRPLDGGITFHTWDDEAVHLACVPGTPCPVLAGLRGADPEALRAAALPALRRAAEPFSDWMLWATNHASGDHVVPVASLDEAPKWATIDVAARVTAAPRTPPGGHVVVAMQDEAGVDFDAVAFEPTKRFRAAVRSLHVGDRVRLVGALDGGTVKLESLRAQGQRRVPVACCGRTMKSLGRGAGVRCRVCGSTRPPDAAHAPFSLEAEVPVSARRHLHRPAGWA